MDQITTCSICYSKYSKPSLVPLILPCGHTFCKSCTNKFSKCPMCREPFTTSTLNIVLFQLIGTKGQPCPHKPKNLFCPTCIFPVCTNCVSNHNMHNLVSLLDPILPAMIEENLNETLSNLQSKNSSLFEDLEKITRLKYMFKSKYDKYMRTLNQEYSIILNRLNTRKRELIDELDGHFSPVFSKFDILLTELDKTLTENSALIENLTKLKTMPVKKQVKNLDQFQGKFINKKMMEKVCDRAKVFPILTIDSNKIISLIEFWGKFKIPSTNFLGFFM